MRPATELAANSLPRLADRDEQTTPERRILVEIGRNHRRRRGDDPSDDLTHSPKQRFPLHAERATEDDERGIQDAGHVGGGDPDKRAHLLDDGVRVAVALRRRPEQVRQPVRRIVRPAPTGTERSESREGLETSPRCEVHVHELRSHAHQANFAGERVMTVVKMPVDQDPGADAGPE